MIIRLILSLTLLLSHSASFATSADGESSSENIQQNANDGEDQSNTAMGVNAGLGAVFTVIAGICYAAEQYGCAAAMTAAAVMSFAQAAIQGGAAGEYGDTAAATGFGGEIATEGTSAGGKLDLDKAIGTGTKNNPDFNKFDAKGFKFDPKTNTATLPDGTQVPVDPSALKDLNSLANAAGLSGDLRAQLMADAKKVIDDAKAVDGPSVVAMDVASGGGGGGSGAGQRGNSALDSLLKDLKKKGTGASNTGLTGTVSGLSKNFMGEPIGLAGDNIFLMIHRRYQKKRTGNEFIEVEPNFRRPASAPVSEVPDYLK